MGVFKYDESLTMAKIVRRKKEKRTVCLSQAAKTNNNNQLNRNVQEMVHFNTIP